MDDRRRARGSLEQEVTAVLREAAGPLTPAQVRDAVGAGLAYTTVMTVLARLHEKGAVTRSRAGRAYAYQLAGDDAELTARRMRRLLDAGEDRARVLSRFVQALSPDDEAVLAELIRPELIVPEPARPEPARPGLIPPEPARSEPSRSEPVRRGRPEEPA